MTATWRLKAYAALGLLCCGGFAVGCTAPAVNEPIFGSVARGTGPLDGLSRRFGQIRSRMRERGYGEEAGLARFFVLEGKGHVTPLDLPEGRCTTVVALAGGTLRALSTAVYDAAGTEVVADTGRSEGGVVHVCPAGEGPQRGYAPHYLVLRSLEGAGAVVAGAFVSDPPSGRGFEGLFDGLLAPVVPFRGVEEALSRTRSVLRDRGLSPMGEPRFEALAEGKSIRLSRELSEGRCYVAVARGDDGLEDVDVAVYDPAGAMVAQDFAIDIEPTLELCAAQSGRHVFEAKVFEGAGAVGLMVLAGGARAESEAGQPEREEIVAETTDRVPAAALVTRAASAFAHRGFSLPMFVTRDSTVGPGEAPVHDLVVERGCVLVLGAASSDETDLDLYLTSEGGVRDRDTGVHRGARVRFCTDGASVVRVVVKAYGRRSAYALAVVRAPEAITDVRGLRLENAAADLAARGFVAALQSEEVLEEGGALSLSTVLRPGRCAAWVVAGDGDVSDVDLFLRNADGSLDVAATGPEPFASLSRCVSADEAPRNVVVEGLVYRGNGSVTMLRLGRAYEASGDDGYEDEEDP